MSAEHRQHLRSQLKHVFKVNYWNYTEYIPVVPHIIIYGSIYYVRYDIWSRLLILCDFDRKDKEFCQLGNAFSVICYEFAGPSCLASVLKYIS